MLLGSAEIFGSRTYREMSSMFFVKDATEYGGRVEMWPASMSKGRSIGN